jgi:hypothetical protein
MVFAQRSSRSSQANTYGVEKETVIDKLNNFFEPFTGLGE